MQTHRTFAALVVFLACAAVSFGQTPDGEGAEPEFVPSFAGERDGRLDDAARSYANELRRRGVLSHRDLRGGDAAFRLWSAGYPDGEVGEILGAGPNLFEVWKAWKKSPEHAALVEDPSWIRWGIGSAEDDGTRIYVVLFWKP